MLNENSIQNRKLVILTHLVGIFGLISLDS